MYFYWLKSPLIYKELEGLCAAWSWDVEQETCTCKLLVGDCSVCCWEFEDFQFCIQSSRSRKKQKKLKKNESSKSKFDIRIRSRSFNIRSFDIRIADADFEFGANDVTFRYFDSSIFGAHYEVEAKDLQWKFELVVLIDHSTTPLPHPTLINLAVTYVTQRTWSYSGAGYFDKADTTYSDRSLFS